MITPYLHIYIDLDAGIESEDDGPFVGFDG
jgi:hypothetical protein